jgi:hypothetical protein
MKKVLLIGGGLAVVGGLAYLYLKNKKKQEAILGTDSATQPIVNAPSEITPVVTTSGATDGGIKPILAGMVVTSTTTASSSEEQAKLDTARDIEAKLKNYYKASALRQRMNLTKPQGIFAISSNSNPYPFLIKKLKDELKILGYEYRGDADGVLIKI